MPSSTVVGPFRALLAAIAVPSLAVMALLPALGCDQSKLGARCSLNVTEAAPTIYRLDQNSLACPSRICLLPPQQVTTDTEALCSVACQVDADCEEGQSRDSGDPTDKRCKSGFSCQPIPLARDASGSQSCQKMCACRDFLDVNAPPPAGCP